MTVAQQAAWNMMVSYLAAETTDDDKSVEFAIAVKDEAQNRTDSGASLVTTWENNDMVFTRLASQVKFCSRKRPSPEE